MVHYQDQQCLPWRASDKRGSDQGTTLNRKRDPDLIEHPLDGTLFVNGWSVSSQVTNLIQQWTGWTFALAGRLIFIHDPGAQCVMPLDQRLKALLQQKGMRAPFETQDKRDIVIDRA